MAILRVIINYGVGKLDDSGLVSECRSISKCMLGNPAYQTLETDVTAMVAICDNFADLVAEAKGGLHATVAEKNSARIELEKILASIGLKVQDLSKGDDLVVINSGYKLRRKSEPVGMLTRPENVIAVPGERYGTIDASWKVVPGSLMYEVQYTIDPPSGIRKWSFLTCSKHYVTIENLPRKATVYMMVAGAGSDPRRFWSDEFSGDTQ